MRHFGAIRPVYADAAGAHGAARMVLRRENGQICEFPEDLGISATDLETSADDLEMFAGDLETSADDLGMFAGDLEVSADDLGMFAGDLEVSADDLRVVAGELDGVAADLDVFAGDPGAGADDLRITADCFGSGDGISPALRAHIHLWDRLSASRTLITRQGLHRQLTSTRDQDPYQTCEESNCKTPERTAHD